MRVWPLPIPTEAILTLMGLIAVAAQAIASRMQITIVSLAQLRARRQRSLGEARKKEISARMHKASGINVLIVPVMITKSIAVKRSVRNAVVVENAARSPLGTP